MTYLFIVAGLILLFLGGELLVRGAVDLAKKLGVSPLFIGLVLVGFGTSTPELMTSLLAAHEGQPGIAMGNVVGSNSANILLILGIAALIYPLTCDKSGFKRDGTFMALATLALIAACYHGVFGRLEGVLFLTIMAAYIIFSVCMEYRKKPVSDASKINEITELPLVSSMWIKDLTIFVIGLILTFIGAHFLLNGAIDLARGLGVSETIIGLTIVAVGTSLPELVASSVAAFRKQSDIAYGNIIGSNIYNILGILGLTGVLSPFVIPEQISTFDIWIMAAATALLMIFSLWGWKISRWKGAVFLMLYVIYTGYLIMIA